MKSIPIIDVSSLVRRSGDQPRVSREIGEACRDSGFFYIVGHGIDRGLQNQLETSSRAFFSLDEATKKKIAMSRGGRAWRGYFPVGNELTSGAPDLKEGIYFGRELGSDHPAVRAGLPLHGPNLFPEEVPELRRAVLAYLEAMTQLGHTLMQGIALSLGLAADYFQEHDTADPLVLFRIFNYPPPIDPRATAAPWGVGEHTDYGLLTILKQDDCGGLEVKTRSGWVQAPPLADSFVCNLGDMLDRMTGGLYHSTPHRVKNASDRARLSFPFFFDPGFQTEVKPLPLSAASPMHDDKDERWDKSSVHAFRGTYGEYLLGKIGKVFPELKREVLT